MTLAALLLASAAIAQGPGGRGMDPALPEAIRADVAAAVQAELDPKRGPANAMRIIEKAQARFAPDSIEHNALGLRRAAIGLRRIFVTRDEFEVPKRYEQALSTFSRLDLTDPGFGDWLKATLEHHPDAKQAFGDGRIELSLLLRGSELKRDKVEAAFRKAFAATGLELRFVPVKNAAFIVKLASEGTKSPRPDQRAVRVIIGLEHVVEGEVEWRSSFFRTTAATNPVAALDAAVAWLARIGGRDLAFRWLGTRGMTTLVSQGPLGLRSHDHEH